MWNVLRFFFFFFGLIYIRLNSHNTNHLLHVLSMSWESGGLVFRPGTLTFLSRGVTRVWCFVDPETHAVTPSLMKAPSMTRKVQNLRSELEQNLGRKSSSHHDVYSYFISTRGFRVTGAVKNRPSSISAMMGLWVGLNVWWNTYH